ncbi:hypothetical protein BDW69DRAFT_155223, partial [Aspergillus filifer]
MFVSRNRVFHRAWAVSDDMLKSFLVPAQMDKDEGGVVLMILPSYRCGISLVLACDHAVSNWAFLGIFIMRIRFGPLPRRHMVVRI